MVPGAPVVDAPPPAAKENGAKPADKPPLAPIKPAPGQSPKTRNDWAEFEKVHEATKKEREDFEKKWQEAQKRATDLEQTLVQSRQREQNYAGLELTLREREEALTAAQAELRMADIRRDPEFVERFDNGKKFHVERLVELGSTFLDKETLAAAIRRGDDDKLSQVREALNPTEMRRWDASLMEIERLDVEREAEVASAEKNWKSRHEKKMADARNQALQQNEEYRKVGHRAIDNIFKAMPFMDTPELRTKVQTAVDGAAGFGNTAVWTPENLLGTVALAMIQQDLTVAQQGLIETKDKEIADLKAEKERLETTMRSKGLIGSEGGGFAANGKEVDPWEDPEATIASRVRKVGR